MAVRILIVGGGGREHALSRQLALSPQRPVIFVAPGNPGTAGVARNVRLTADAPDRLAAFCKDEQIGLVIIGPEDPLIAGLADRLRAAGLAVFGPGADGARIEGDKGWAKEILAAAGVPTAPYALFDNRVDALAYLDGVACPVVVKAVGAAQGKGVAVCPDRVSAVAHVEACLGERRFGRAGERVLIESCLEGPELSVLAVTDGRDYALLAPARDHKRVGDGDIGPNTGGMGAFAPVPFGDPSLAGVIARRVIEPTLAELRRRAIDFRGVLYAGLMLTATGPQVLEFNCRFGDPETQAVLPLLRGDFLALVQATAAGRLGEYLAQLSPPGLLAPCDWPGASLTDWTRACVAVVGAAAGYPGPYARGTAVHLPAAPGDEAWIVQAGTALVDGRLVSAGGRVLAAVGLGADLARARDRAYALMAGISSDGLHYRRDIARVAGARAEV